MIDATAREVVSWSIGTFLGVGAILGLLIRYMLLPYLRENLDLARATNRQVTDNGHKNGTPTVRDDISDFRAETTSRLEQLAERHDKQERRLEQLSAQLDRHLDRAEMETHRIWGELRGKQDR